MRSKLVIGIIALCLLTLPLTGAICGGGDEIGNVKADLTVWIIGEEKASFDNTVINYTGNHPKVTIEIVEKTNLSSYETELIDAIASGSAPDIALIKSDWLPKHYDKLVSMPEKEDTDVLKEFRETYIDVIVNDMIIDNKIYGIPIKVDTLALYTNTDQLIKAGINNPPTNWEEFIYDVKKLTKRDNFGNITRAGAAIGTSNNVSYSQDILYNIMLQNSTRMVSDDKKSATFNTSITKASGDVYYPGTSSLNFYTSFANPSKETYTWNSSMKNSREAFVKEEVSMFFGYLDDEDKIYNLSPTISFQISPMPQIKDSTNPVSYPSYFTYVVTNNSKAPDVAWDFINEYTNNNRETKKQEAVYLYDAVKTGGIGFMIFQGQPYIAESWYKSKEPGRVDKMFNQMISSVINGQPLQAAIDAASAEVTEILQTKG